MSRCVKDARRATTPDDSGPDAFKKGKLTGGVTRESGRDRKVISPITPATTPRYEGPSVYISKYKD